MAASRECQAHHSQLPPPTNISVHTCHIPPAQQLNTVASILDYCNSLLVCVSGTLQSWLISTFSAAARLLFSARRSKYTISLLCELHWSRLCVLAYCWLHGNEPSHQAEILHLTLVLNISILYLHWYYMYLHSKPHMVTVHFWYLRLKPEMHCQHMPNHMPLMHLAFKQEVKTLLFKAFFDITVDFTETEFICFFEHDSTWLR